MRVVAVLVCLLFIPVAVAQTSAGGGASVCARDEVDCDKDGLPDKWEREYFDSLNQTGADDPDGDGHNNTAEYRMHTDPTDPEDPDRDDAADDDQADHEDRSGRGDGSLADACRDRDDKRDCVQDYCRKHEDRDCAQLVHRACNEGRIQCAALTDKCVQVVAYGANGRAAEVCKQLARADVIRTDSRFVEFDIASGDRALLNYTVSGTLLFDAIMYSGEDDDFEVKQDGKRIRFKADDARVEIHDTPTGQFWFRSDEDTLVLDLADGATATEVRNGIDIQFEDRRGRVVGDDVSLAGDLITIVGHASFFTPADSSVPGLDKAKDARTLGAEVKFGSDVVAYDDLEVNVTGDPSAGPVRVVVGAELESGRTISIDLNVTGNVDLRYFDLNDDGTETEVVFRMAESLDDVLNPDDDGGQPEYWVVTDAAGTHVLVSVPHWSVHIIEIAVDFLTQPSVLIGIGAGVAGVGVAGAAMFWPRRRQPF